MKKILLLAVAALLTAIGASAIESLSEADLASVKNYKLAYVGPPPNPRVQLTIKQAINVEDTCSASYVNGDVTQLKISNFLGKGYAVTATLDWAAGTLSLPVSQVSSLANIPTDTTKLAVYISDSFLTSATTAVSPDELKKHTLSGTITASEPDSAGIETYTFVVKNAELFKANTLGEYKLVAPATFTVTFTAQKSTGTGVTQVAASRSVACRHYVSMQGQVSSQPFSGVNVLVTTYTDGSTSSCKVMGR